MTAQLDVLRTKVGDILAEEFGTPEIDARGVFSLQDESARVFVHCRDWDNGDTIVAIEAPVLFDVQLSADLYEYVATDGAGHVFGHLRVHRDDESTLLAFEHNLLGDFLDPAELNRAVVAVLQTANRLDDELKPRFGGRRFHEDQ